MSSYGKRESHFENLSREVVESQNIPLFFERLHIFRAEILNEVDLSHVYSFRQLCASLHEEQYAELRNFRGTLDPGTVDKFFDDLVITPHLMLRLAFQAGEHCLHPKTKLEGLSLAEQLLTRLPALGRSSDDEDHLLSRSLRKLACVLSGTEIEHAFADAFLTNPIGGVLRPSVAIKAYLSMGDREVIDHTAGDDLTQIDVPPKVAEGAHKWLRMNESKIVEVVADGGFSPAFNGELAFLAQNKGFPNLAWIIRQRQQDYRPEEILKNVIDFGAHPDATFIELEERKSGSIRSKLDSNAAFIAYCLVHNIESTVLTQSNNLRIAQTKALKAMASLGAQPHASHEGTVLGIAAELIASASDHEDVCWLPRLNCLSEMIKSSRKYQGMRLESDLGM